MLIDLNAVKDTMVSMCGYTHTTEYEGWTESLIDALQNLYDFETKLTKLFEGETEAEEPLINKILGTIPPKNLPILLGLDPELDTLISKILSKDK